MSEKINLILKDTKNHKALKKRKRLMDEELENVTGGYWEYSGYSAGCWIECPFCGRTDESNFNTWADTQQGVDQFRCKCGGAFAVDTEGKVYF